MISKEQAHKIGDLARASYLASADTTTGGVADEYDTSDMEAWADAMYAVAVAIAVHTNGELTNDQYVAAADDVLCYALDKA